MAPLERFLRAEEDRLPVLVRAGLAHVQFETIHPFLDGNGRVGRLLITLLLVEKGVLSAPLLYLMARRRRPMQHRGGLSKRSSSTFSVKTQRLQVSPGIFWAGRLV